MIYEYECEKCSANNLESLFEIVKPVSEYNKQENCPRCGAVLSKVFGTFQFYGAKNEDAEYNHGLGQVIKSKKERKEVAKRMGLIEVGNEKVESIHKHATITRQEKIKKKWDEVEI